MTDPLSIGRPGPPLLGHFSSSSIFKCTLMKPVEYDPPDDNLKNLVVAVGASAGGLEEISSIVEWLPTWFMGTMVVAYHRSPSHVNMLAKILAHRARVQVEEPEDDDFLETTVIYVGRSTDRVEVDGEQFDVEEDVSFGARMRRIDDLFESVAESAGPNAIGVILSGMLSDGVEGLRAIHEAGGYCIVQSPEDAQFASMPLNALRAVPVNFVGTSEEIASVIMELSITRRSL